MCCTTYSESQEASSLSSLSLLKCGISCLTAVLCASETLVILELLENQNRRSSALPVISSPKTSDFISRSSPSLWICQSQSACRFIDFLEICHSRTCLPLPLHIFAQAQISLAITLGGGGWGGKLAEQQAATDVQLLKFLASNSSSLWCLSSNHRVHDSSIQVSMPLRSLESAHQNHFWDSHKPKCQKTIKNKSNGFRIIIFYYAKEAKGTAALQKFDLVLERTRVPLCYPQLPGNNIEIALPAPFPTQSCLPWKRRVTKEIGWRDWTYSALPHCVV